MIIIVNVLRMEIDIHGDYLKKYVNLVPMEQLEPMEHVQQLASPANNKIAEEQHVKTVPLEKQEPVGHVIWIVEVVNNKIAKEQHV